MRGFFHWTGVDNYEWLRGFDVSFGLLDARVSLLLFLTFTGCATMPTVETMQLDRRCHVWLRNLFGANSVRVEGGVAYSPSLFGEQPGAYYSSPTEIAMPSLFGGQDLATYANRELSFHSLFGDLPPIVFYADTAELKQLFGSIVFEFNHACTDSRSGARRHQPVHRAAKREQQRDPTTPLSSISWA